MRRKLWGRVFVGSGLLGLLLAVSLFGTVAQAIPKHGAGIRKGCENPSKAGDKLNCEATVGYNDDFGDTTTILEVYDVVDTLGSTPDRIRVPQSGNLPIVAVGGNTTCTVGGSLPCKIGPAGSTLSGLPGTGEEGEVTFRQNTYVVQPDDPDPLSDQVTAVYRDECDSQGTEGCSGRLNIIEAPASVDLVHPGLTVDKSSECSGENTIDYTIEICNTGDVELIKKGVVDSLIPNINAQFGPSLDNGACETIQVTYNVQGGDPDPLINTVTAVYQVDELPNILRVEDSQECDIKKGNGGGGGRRRRHRESEVLPVVVTSTTIAATSTTVAAVEVTPVEELPFTGLNDLWLLAGVSLMFVLLGAGLLILV